MSVVQCARLGGTTRGRMQHSGTTMIQSVSNVSQHANILELSTRYYTLKTVQVHRGEHMMQLW